MATPKIFITGVTGFVGGDVLYVLSQAHPDWQLSALIRSSTAAAKVGAAYPSLRIVQGDLNDADLLTREAAAADVVIHIARSDDMTAVRALADGAGSTSTADKPKYYIHCSGTGSLASFDKHPDSTTAHQPLGTSSDLIWDDVKDIARFLALKPEIMHQPTDQVTFRLSEQYPHVKTAIMCPPAIYGNGRGPILTYNTLVAGLSNWMVQRGRGYMFGEGNSIWNFVHVAELADAFLRITEAAIGVAPYAQKATWNDEGLYFVCGTERAWGPLMQRMAQRLFEAGKLPNADVQPLLIGDDSKDQGEYWAQYKRDFEAGKSNAADVQTVTGKDGNEELAFLAQFIGANSRARSSRAKALLDWEAKVTDVEAMIDEYMKHFT